ncbi:MAG: ATP-binding protein [Bacteroidota bacterium]|nr:ATP-binding protein [Bacteroidota bacterium]
MSRHIIDLIAQGEHQKLDFKFQVNDAKKIARSLSAFANTDGGRLLIGVKDNGRIAGIRSEEEYYMIDSAAEMFCKPPLKLKANPHSIQGKQLLEVIIPVSENRPVLAPDSDGVWQAYVRFQDNNLIADDILLNVWKMQHKKQGAFIRYADAEKDLLDVIEKEPLQTHAELSRRTKIKPSVLRRVLMNFVAAEILLIQVDMNGSRFYLNEDFDPDSF